MLEIFAEVGIVDVLQILGPIFFLIGAFICVTVVLGVLSIIFRPAVRAEAVATLKTFAHNVKVATMHLLF